MAQLGLQDLNVGKSQMSRNKNTPALSVDLPSRLKEELKKYAKLNDITVSQLVRRIIREFLNDAEAD